MSSPLGKHLKGKTEASENSHWSDLYRKALRLAQRQSDPKAKILQAHADDKEHILRSLSIVSEDDLEREFG